jgi:hypothetical protein
MIYNFGRVKRLEYETAYRNGAVYKKPEMIMAQHVIKAVNHFKKDELHNLVSKLILSGRHFNLKITRLVYYYFVAPFDLNDRSIKIICKEGDGLHIVPDNLQKANRSVISRRVVARGRMESLFKNLPLLKSKNSGTPFYR